MSITVSRARSDDDARIIANTLIGYLEGRNARTLKPHEPSCQATGCRLTTSVGRLVVTLEWSNVNTEAASGIASSIVASLAQRGTGCASTDAGQVQPIWKSEDEWKQRTLVRVPFTLEMLAQRAAPILWKSPREPITQPIPQLIPEGSWAFSGETAKTPHVYYRIRRVLLRDGVDDAQKRRIADRVSAATELATTWDSIDLAVVEQIFVRYLFYFPEDRGIGQHAHDLESAEVNIGVARCLATADGRCEYKAYVRTVTTSAHGVGWYTGILDVCSAPDTRLPLTLLVEEGKHATTPDRDGDGEFKPHYDVNVHSNDAWGVRDTAATKQLGGASFRADQTKRRLRVSQVFPRPIYSNQRIRETYRREFDDEDSRLVDRYLEKLQTHPDEDYFPKDRYYDLQPSVLSPPCKGVDGQTTYESRRKRYETAIAEHTLTKEEERNSHELFDLLEGKGFCDVPDLVERTDWSHRLAQRINAISPGPRNEYGFMSEAQRFSFAYRQDDGSGFSAIVPLGLELRAIGGWLVGKTDFIFGEFKGKSTELRRSSYGATYSPSASRFADWYVAVAHEGTLEESGERRWHVAEELGVRLRFAILKAPLFKFYGGRIGVRAEGLGRFENVRLVFELGAGAW